MRPPPRVLVIALGNPDRGDDGVGLAVAQCLRELLPNEVPIISASGDALGLIPTWAEFDAIICIDAVASANAPGSIHRFDLTAADLPNQFAVASSHALGLVDAIALARALQETPRQIIVYGVEGVCFAAAAPLTPEVAAAIVDVAHRVAAEVHRLRQEQATVNV
jgi:hydrogenase maturation protease